MDIDELCSKILSLEGVRFCAVRSLSVEILAGGQREGISHLESAEERVDSKVRIAMLGGLIEKMPKSFGKARAISIEFENLRMLFYPLPKERVIHVTTDPSTFQSVATTISELVSQFL
jgi:hypothetical protein